jgi:FMN phosphatase YigB (HAD superfamily)
MENRDCDVVVFACQGTLLNWTGAIAAAVYELARRNGDSPLDRGAALQRRVEQLTREQPEGPCLARAFERLAHERGYRNEESGEETLSRVISLVSIFPDALGAVEVATGTGRRVVVVSRADRRLVEGALRPLDGAVDAIVTHADLVPRLLGAPAQRILQIGASPSELGRAHALGIRTAWLNRGGRPALVHEPRPDCAWRSLDELPEALGLAPRHAPVAA